MITAAFAGAPHSDGTEAALVERLRGDDDLTVSLVAQDSGGTIIGHVAFSPVTIADGTPGVQQTIHISALKSARTG